MSELDIVASPPASALEIWTARTAWGLFAVALTPQGRLAALSFPAANAVDACARAAAVGHPGAAIRREGALGRESPLRRQLEEFARGRRRRFSLPLSLGRHGSFALSVWREVERIPYGRRRSYGETAKAIGNAGAARAVGGALGRNPVPLVIPCHRVV
jgi:O-6-methylguanine DNA methyltransferase